MISQAIILETSEYESTYDYSYTLTHEQAEELYYQLAVILGKDGSNVTNTVVINNLVDEK